MPLNDSVEMNLSLTDEAWLITFTEDVMKNVLGIAQGSVVINLSSSNNGEEGLKITFRYAAAAEHDSKKRHVSDYKTIANNFPGYGLELVEYPDSIKHWLGPKLLSASLFVHSVACAEERKTDKQKENAQD